MVSCTVKIIATVHNKLAISCFKDLDQICNHSQLVAILKVNLVCQRAIKQQ